MFDVERVFYLARHPCHYCNQHNFISGTPLKTTTYYKIGYIPQDKAAPTIKQALELQLTPVDPDQIK